MRMDLGCGVGGFTNGTSHHPKNRGSWLLKHNNAETVALDVNASAIKVAKERIGNNIHYVVADGEILPFADDSFEYIRERGVFHHTSHYHEAIAEIARVLKPSGVLRVLEVVDNYQPYAIVRRALGKWKGEKIVSFFTSDDLIEEIGKYFDVRRVTYWWRPMVLDIPSYSWDTYPGWLAGVYFMYYVSLAINRIGLGKRMCCQVTVVAEKR